jgi:hypothetical protein
VSKKSKQNKGRVADIGPDVSKYRNKAKKMSAAVNMSSAVCSGKKGGFYGKTD